jgi:3-oxoacyl-[acyl-carrier-protein] synthase-3
MKRILVIGAETMTRLLDWNDRTTSVCSAMEQGPLCWKHQMMIAVFYRPICTAMARSRNCFIPAAAPARTALSGKILMEGREVFRHAVQRLAEVVDETLAANRLDKSDITWLVPHQANKRIIDSTAEKLGLPAERVVLTVGKHGNTSAASVPLALAHGVEQGLFKPKGDLLLLEAMGAGLTWGAALVRW